MKRTVRIAGEKVVQTLTIHQWANDWISADTISGRGVIVNPLKVTLDEDEIAMMRADEAEYCKADYHHTGTFWADYKLNDDGTFARRITTEVPR